ncbi:hypothetical protein N7486_011344 [Penicillium sp. IBT 16267x]|nr:hypothetical protein N7486_011344 [Penicillium sp. IBT 16267x]
MPTINKGNELLGNAEQMFDLTNETYNLDQSVLNSYAYKPPHELTGYDESFSVRVQAADHKKIQAKGST